MNISKLTLGAFFDFYTYKPNRRPVKVRQNPVTTRHTLLKKAGNSK